MLKNIILSAILVGAAIVGLICLTVAAAMDVDTLGVDTAWPATTQPRNPATNITEVTSAKTTNDPHIEVTIRGADDEFDRRIVFPGELTPTEKSTIRFFLERAKARGAKFYPLDPEKPGTKK